MSQGRRVGEADNPDLVSLKEVLFQEERAELAALHREIDEAKMDEDALADLLPGAVRTSAGKDERLGAALGPLIGSAIATSVKRDPEQIVDAISPIMGPAIRESIRLAIQSMTQSLNKALEYSVSPKGLRWRWEAFTTGKSFAEVVLLHTLLYRVTDIFIVHRESGLLIQHVSTSDETSMNADLTSGMLTAIQDFARDSFGAGDDESLRTIAMGDQTIWVETGPYAYLAAVIEGEAPADLRINFQECLEKAHRDYAKPLQSFRGDDRQLKSLKAVIRDYLLSAYEHDQKQEQTTESSPDQKKRFRGYLVIATVIGGLGLWLLFATLKKSRQVEYAQRVLAVPDKVEMEFRGDGLILKGEARHDWIAETRRMAPRILDVSSVNMSELIDLDQPWFDYVKNLRTLDGIIVTNTQEADGNYVVEGLWDPRICDNPTELIREFAVNPAHVQQRWNPVRLAQTAESPAGE